MGKNDEYAAKISAVVKLNGKWASTMEPEELSSYIESRLSSSIGFRGEILKLTVKVGKKAAR